MNLDLYVESEHFSTVSFHIYTEASMTSKIYNLVCMWVCVTSVLMIYHGGWVGGFQRRLGIMTNLC